MTAQRADPDLLKITKECHREKVNKEPSGYRVACDGLLERHVAADGRVWWSPVVPEGNATAHMTWKRWCFLQCHNGIFGAHRLEEKPIRSSGVSCTGTA